MSRPAQTDVMAKNTRLAYGAKQSQEMDFSGPDRLTAVQVSQLNRILWHSIKGPQTPCPSPVHRALLTATGQAAPPDEKADKD